MRSPIQTEAIIIAIIGYLACSADAADHLVGDAIWTIPPSNEFYANWANNTTIIVGDVLVFRFETGFYDVVQVSRREYESCEAENPFNTLMEGPAKVVVVEEGMRYFICSFGNYCMLGQKVCVAVLKQPA